MTNEELIELILYFSENGYKSAFEDYITVETVKGMKIIERNLERQLLYGREEA